MKLSTRLRMLSPAEHDPHLIKAIMLAAADEIDRLANAIKASSELWERIMDASRIVTTGRSHKETMMATDVNEHLNVERLNRVEALNNAVRHRLREETADDVVKSAQKYFEFLQSKATPSETA